MSEKIVISKPGFDVTTTTNAANLIFSSDYNTLKYFLSGTHNLSINGNGSTQVSKFTVAHNLGYKPYFTCLVSGGTAFYNTVPIDQNTAAPNTFLYAGAYADGTNLYLTLQTNYSLGSTASVNYAYKIYKNNVGL